MATNSSRKRLEPQRSDDVWHRLAFFIFTLIIGFIGGLMAVRLYTDNLNLSALSNPEAKTKVVLTESELIADIAQKLAPSVVSINIESQSHSNFFFGRVFTQKSAGTGIIVSRDGLILTNKHVVPDNYSKLTVVLSDGTVYKDVEVVDKDLFNDVAFIKVRGAKDLQPAPLGDSSKMRIGDKVIAIGNALGQFDNTVTSGIISGTGRPVVAGDGLNSEQLQNLFQTDAAINPGNSGGPLVNINGEVIGVNTAVAGGAENIGFAIPINDIKPLLESVKSSGKIIRPYLGVRYLMLNEQIAKQLDIEATEGAYITGSGDSPAVIAGSPADKAGIKDGDIITAIDGEKVSKDNTLMLLISRHQVGDKVKISLIRDGRTMDLSVTLEEAPSSL